jgi:glycosyltransferase 2 family protein
MKLLIRLLVTLAIFWLMMRSINLRQVWEIAHQARIDLLVVALVMQFGSTTVSAYRWQLIMRNLHFGQSFPFYWRSYFKAMLFNQVLPTSIGGDALRVLDVAGLGFRKRDVLYGVILDRITGLAALILFSLFACAFNSNLLPAPVYYLILLIATVGLSLVAAIFASTRLGWLNSCSRRAMTQSLLIRIHQAFSESRILLAMASLLIPLLALLGFFFTGWALGLRYDLVTYFIIVPPVILLTMIPVSMAGWGVREGALVALFSWIGAEQATVMALSILYGLTLIVVSTPGFLIYLDNRPRRFSTRQPTAIDTVDARHHYLPRNDANQPIP